MIKVYPNPARSTAYVSIPSTMKGSVSLTVRNSNGEIIEENIYAEDDTQLITLNLSGHPNGFYKVILSDKSQELSYELLNLGEMKYHVMD
jgi:hypothetical protein